MSKIFISHSSANNAAALALGRWLEERGWDEYFLEFDLQRGVASGDRWQEALKAAADRCEAVLLLIWGCKPKPPKIPESLWQALQPHYSNSNLATIASRSMLCPLSRKA